MDDTTSAVTTADTLGPTEVLAYVGGSDDARATRVLGTARAVVARYLATPERVATVPAEVLAHAVLVVASEVWHAQDAPHGVANYADEGAAPVRVARDPLTAARPFLAPYVGLGIG